MKIAINSLPRAGTKGLQRNFQRYLLATGNPVLAPDHIDGIKEPFNFTTFETEMRMTKDGFLGLSPSGIVIGQKYQYPITLLDELQNRFKMLYARPESWVFKRTAFGNYDPILYSSAMLLDKCIAITKEDVFTHCVGYTLARHLDLWNASTELTSAIAKHRLDQITLSIDAFSSYYRWFKDFNNIKWSSEIQVVKFEDMINIASDTEFCEFFNIPYIPFDFQPFELEYGINKLYMVANLDELKATANKLDA